MKEFIEAEKAKLQALFNPFNEIGSWMRLAEKGTTTVRLGLVESFTVTRVAPQFDAAGDVVKVDFWLLFKMAGYDEGFQYSHTIKAVKWSQADSYLIDLTDDLGREFHVEEIFPDLDPELADAWRFWKRYRAENAERLARADAEILAQHIRIAEEWE